MRKASLKQHRTHDGRWQLFPVLVVNGRPDPRTVLIGENPISWKDPGGGKFYLDYRDEQGKRVRQPCGATPKEARDAWIQQVGILNGTMDAPEEDSLDFSNSRQTIQHAVKQYLVEIKGIRSKATHEAYSDDAAWFVDRLKKHYVDEVGRTDLLRILGLGRDEGLEQRTINRRVLVGLMALRNAGATINLKRGEWPKVAETEVEIYSTEELRAFFKACSEEEKLLFQIYLCSGFRNREVATLTKDSVSSHTNSIGVKKRPEYKFFPKNYECRNVRIPEPLIRKLVAHIKRQSGKLVFPTKPHPKRPNYGGEQPDAHHLELCKNIAFKAGLNCGHCISEDRKRRCAKGPHCEHWFLHKWRHTYATNMLRDGMDIKTLQEQLGHKNLATTEKYLKSLAIEDIGEKVDGSRLAALIE